MLFNPWKHHARYLRERIDDYYEIGEVGLQLLAKELKVLGTELMDLYYGSLPPEKIAIEVIRTLKENHLLQVDAYTNWLQAESGYGIVTLEDQSQWVLRMGAVDGRFVHVHPGRWVPQTRRVRANVLKTAVLVKAYATVHNADPLDIKIVNHVRLTYLELSPMAKVGGDKGLAPIIQLLTDEE